MDPIANSRIIDYITQSLFEEYKKTSHVDDFHFHRDLLQGLLLLRTPADDENCRLEMAIIMLLCYLEDGDKSRLRYDEEQNAPTAMEVAISHTQSLLTQFCQSSQEMGEFLKVAIAQAVYVCCRDDNFSEAVKVLDRLSSEYSFSTKELQSLRSLIHSQDVNHPVLKQHPYSQLHGVTMSMVSSMMNHLSEPVIQSPTLDHLDTPSPVSDRLQRRPQSISPQLTSTRVEDHREQLPSNHGSSRTRRPVRNGVERLQIRNIKSAESLARIADALDSSEDSYLSSEYHRKHRSQLINARKNPHLICTKLRKAGLQSLIPDKYDILEVTSDSEESEIGRDSVSDVSAIEPLKTRLGIVKLPRTKPRSSLAPIFQQKRPVGRPRKMDSRTGRLPVKETKCTKFPSVPRKPSQVWTESLKAKLYRTVQKCGRDWKLIVLSEPEFKNYNAATIERKWRLMRRDDDALLRKYRKTFGLLRR